MDNTKPTPSPITGMSDEQMFMYVYEKAKEYGDPHPEVVAAQFMFESAKGTSQHLKDYNNPFGLTTLESDPNKAPSKKLNKDGKPLRYWKTFDTVDDAIKFRVDNWSLGKTSSKAKKEAAKKYRETDNPLLAMAYIQPLYAPTADPVTQQGHYTMEVGRFMKDYGFYEGDINVPNYDVDPDYWDALATQSYSKETKQSFVDTENMTQEEKNKIWGEYNTEIDNIDPNLPENLRRLKLKEINKKYWERGLITSGDGKKPGGLINEMIDAEREEFAQNWAKYQNLKNVLEEGELYYKKDGTTVERMYFDFDNANVRKAVKDYPEIFSKWGDGNVDLKRGKVYLSNYKSNDPNAESSVEKLLRNYDQIATEIGDTNKLEISYIKDVGKPGSPLTDRDIKGMIIRPEGEGLPTWRQFTNLFRGKKKGSLHEKEIDQRSDEQIIADVQNRDYRYVTPDPTWKQDQAKEWQRKTEAKEAEGRAAGEELTRTETPTEAEVNETPTETETETEEPTYDSDAWYNFMPEDVPEDIGYDKDNYKDPLPIGESLTNLAGMAIGMNQAQKPTARRDEQVSDAFRQYAHELKMLSEMGLRPEEEAYAKDMLSQAYSQGIHNVTRASGGNRNQVLANMGRLDAQNMQGKMQLAVEDARAKNEALFKYGEAMKYINEFDARRDIANNERQYQEDMLSKEAGAQLASSSLQNFMNDIQYWKENKPGSANHAYRSMMMKRIFGVDPMLKDDGTGNTKWTTSWREKENRRIVAENEQSKRDQKIWMSLDDQQKQFVEDFNKRTNFDFDSKILEHVGANRNVGDYQVKWDELPNINDNNFSSLFEDIEQTNLWDFSKPQNID